MTIEGRSGRRDFMANLLCRMELIVLDELGHPNNP
jgi:hypothetical protein